MIILDRQTAPFDWACRSQIDGQPLRWQVALGPVATWARRLAGLALPPGSRIACCLPPGPDLAALLQAAPRAGLCLGLIDHRLSLVGQEDQLARIDAACLIHDGHQLDHPRSLPCTGPWAEASATAAPAGADDTVLLIPTSGSSGTAKLVRLTLSNLLHAAQAATIHLDLTADTCWCCPLPLDHIGGVMCIWRACFSGGQVLLSPPAVLRDALPRCSGASLVPSMLARLLDESDEPCPTSCRQIVIGGAALDAALQQRALDRGYPVRRSYGSTESCSMACTQRQPGGTDCGPLLPGLELRIDADRQIHLRGPQCATDQLDQGWLATGDTGRLDAEGRLIVDGRLDDRIISGGENVDPRLIEDRLRSHPAVCDAWVTGLPDPRWGQVVAAALVGHQPPDWNDWLRRHCSAAERPKTVCWLEALPLTGRGKIDRQAILSMFNTTTE